MFNFFHVTSVMNKNLSSSKYNLTDGRWCVDILRAKWITLLHLNIQMFACFIPVMVRIIRMKIFFNWNGNFLLLFFSVMLTTFK